MNIKKSFEEINIDVDKVSDPHLKTIIIKLLNIIEYLSVENKGLKEKNQKLKDENNRLKGEQGKSVFSPQTKKDISSEKERKTKKKKKSKRKKHKIIIDRVVKCTIDELELPPDAVFKGYQSVVVQDIVIKKDNVEFKKEIYYSPSTKKTFIANLPDGYHGEFGPNLKALIVSLHSNSKMTEPAIVEFLETHGVMISAATVSRIITDNHGCFHQEKKDIVQAGLPSTIYQQMDDTSARVNGKNNYTHILCNEYYTAYFTRLQKDRLTILEILSQRPLTFRFNESSYALMEQMQLPNKTIRLLKKQKLRKLMNREEVDNLLKTLFQNPNKHHTNRLIILEASAIIAYQELDYSIPLLLTDDAPQFKQITEMLALCWVHDGRHYKKLDPALPVHRKRLAIFLRRYWKYYRKLLAYKRSPTSTSAKILRKEFKILFSTKTGYDALDDRIKKTKLKKDSLLLVLKYPEIPLHNNASELGARVQARYRDISFQTKNKKGTEAKDTFMTIVSTAKKLGVNAFHYIRDRISKQFKMPSLSSLITIHNTS